ncbi:MAG TPA: RHS repeat-associated core domain-containing protein, partial [Chthonomonadales bacterium]|nr:RHS repeat-associated core domain-containing protein [Chthonomonadales bacterium]
ENRMTGVANPDGTSETHVYSADNMRQKKVTSAGTVLFVRDGQNVLIETDGSGVTQAHYTDYPGMRGGLAPQRRGTASSFYGFDNQQSCRVLVSVGGLVTDSCSFKAFGDELAAGSGATTATRYVGVYGYYRDIPNRAYLRARHSQELSGRWISRDPHHIGRLGGQRYLYAGNQPMHLLDPTGLVAVTPANVSDWRVGLDSTQQGCCGGYRAYRQLHLDNLAGQRGYIVQRVDVNAFGWPCVNLSSCFVGPPESFTITYWEAWPIDQGGRGPTSGGGPNWDNSFAWRAERGYCSASRVEFGQVKFFYSVHNGIPLGVDDRPKGGACSRYAGGLSCIDDPPWFWYGSPDQGEKEAYHWVIGGWICCYDFTPLVDSKTVAFPAPWGVRTPPC